MTGPLEIASVDYADIVTRSIAPYPTAVQDTFTVNSTGSIPTAPTGHAYTVSSSGGSGAAGGSVVGGYVVAIAPNSPQTTNSCYIQVELDDTMKSFQTEFVLDQSGVSIAMLSKTMSRIVVGDAWLHLEIHSTAWNLTYVTNPGGTPTFNPIASGSFITSLPVGTGKIYRAKMNYGPATSSLTVLLPAPSSIAAGPTATITNNAGVVFTVTDANIAANIGQYIAIEPVTNLSGTGSRYKAFSAGTDGGQFPMPTPTLQDMVTALAPFAVPPPKTLTLLTDKTYTSASLATISELQHTVDQLNQVYRVEGVIYYDAITTVQMLFALSVTANAQQWGLWSVEAAGPAETTVDSAGNHWVKAFGLAAGKCGTAGNAVIMRCRIEGTFLSNATGVGFLVPQVAQGTVSAGNPLTIHTGSWLRLTPVTDTAV